MHASYCRLSEFEVCLLCCGGCRACQPRRKTRSRSRSPRRRDRARSHDSRREDDAPAVSRSLVNSWLSARNGSPFHAPRNPRVQSSGNVISLSVFDFSDA
eukprot:scaffold515916_cov17-Prasinocladus_malaysianus.AAC.1